MSQMNLLDWTPPVRVILFPLIKRVGKVRHTAKIINSKSRDEASAYWRQVVSGLYKHMEKNGIHKEDADREIREFFDAVQNELNRLSYMEQGTGGAA